MVKCELPWYRTTSQTDCNNVQINSTDAGYISSPNYPNNYLDNLQCTWSITVDKGNQIQLIVEDFSTESLHDQIYIYDNYQQQQQKLLANYSGQLIASSSSDIKSTSNTMVILFKTDHSQTRSGFKLSFKEIVKTINLSKFAMDNLLCESNLTNQTGSISYLSNVNNQLNNKCLWNITTNPGKTIMYR
ncbi:deleted in malignant brain tumors 1 protein-like [Oppia nitens]|uniref:deleted in malignant brain tumors 1 protein-like n=1 Tax=Oppia nitens TaxID=1686743 RepID=UPI0023D9F0BA|nr:deleted in malignant brain tumors 1 protein-like [Oppia nitens]